MEKMNILLDKRKTTMNGTKYDEYMEVKERVPKKIKLEEASSSSSETKIKKVILKLKLFFFKRVDNIFKYNRKK